MRIGPVDATIDVCSPHTRCRQRLLRKGRGRSCPGTPTPARRPLRKWLFRSVAGGCHSNLTTWPWYPNVAPVSWLVQRDVSGGRGALNFSEWNRPQDGAGDAVGAVAGGSMPPWFYVILHPKAKLAAAERQGLIDGLAATLRRSPPIAGG